MDRPPDPARSAARPHQGARPGGRSARVRAAVLHAATEELVARGYDGFSPARVAAAAGVALSTVHRRWPEKAALVADAVGEVAAQQVPDPAEATLRDDLRALAGAIATMLAEPPVVAMLRAAFALPDAELDRLRDAFWPARFAVAQAVVDRAARRGEVPEGADGWRVVEPLYAQIWMRRLITGLPVDDAFLAEAVEAAVAQAARVPSAESSR